MNRAGTFMGMRGRGAPPRERHGPVVCAYSTAEGGVASRSLPGGCNAAGIVA